MWVVIRQPPAVHTRCSKQHHVVIKPDTASLTLCIVILPRLRPSYSSLVQQNPTQHNTHGCGPAPCVPACRSAPPC
jgi:hypothetical protein